jgi:hypothetical protein
VVQETQQTVQQQHAPHVQLAHTATVQQTHHVLHAASENTKMKKDKHHVKVVVKKQVVSIQTVPKVQRI